MRLARSVPSADQRAAPRGEAVAKVTASLPTAWFGEFRKEDELVVFQAIMDEVLANGHCQMTRRELAELPGAVPI